MATLIDLNAEREKRNMALPNELAMLTGDESRQASLTRFYTQLERVVSDFSSTSDEGNMIALAGIIDQIESFRCELEEIEDMVLFLKNISIQQYAATNPHAK